MKLSTKQQKKIRNRFEKAAAREHVLGAIFQPCGEADAKGTYRGRVRILLSTDFETSAAHTARVVAAVQKAVRGILRAPEIAVSHNGVGFQPSESATSGKPFLLEYS